LPILQGEKACGLCLIAIPPAPDKGAGPQ
jgi:hypothetical protein